VLSISIKILTRPRKGANKRKLSPVSTSNKLWIALHFKSKIKTRIITAIGPAAGSCIIFRLLTRIPLNINITVSEQRLGLSILFYPLVGLLIGTLLLILSHLLPEQSFAINAAIILTA
jgi:hypothetical protein